jgi:DNA-binding transcriptional ArsR family regulator
VLVDADADLFKAIGDATRRTILDELTDKDGQTLFEICGRLTLRHGLASSRQAISQHLAVLEQAGLVHARR